MDNRLYSCLELYSTSGIVIEQYELRLVRTRKRRKIMKCSYCFEDKNRRREHIIPDGILDLFPECDILRCRVVRKNIRYILDGMNRTPSFSIYSGLSVNTTPTQAFMLGNIR